MTSATTPHSEEQCVLAAEDEYVAAELSRNEAALRRLVDDSFQYNSGRGTTSGKEELIAGVLQMNMVGQTIKERSVLIEGNVALVFGTPEIRFAGTGKPDSMSTLRYTATYLNRQGQWRMLALQMQQRAPQCANQEQALRSRISTLSASAEGGAGSRADPVARVPAARPGAHNEARC
jgi:hypothetical protein